MLLITCSTDHENEKKTHTFLREFVSHKKKNTAPNTRRTFWTSPCCVNSVEREWENFVNFYYFLFIQRVVLIFSFIFHGDNLWYSLFFRYRIVGLRKDHHLTGLISLKFHYYKIFERNHIPTTKFYILQPIQKRWKSWIR